MHYCVSFFFSPVCKTKEIFHCVALTKWSLQVDFPKTAWGCHFFAEWFALFIRDNGLSRSCTAIAVLTWLVLLLQGRQLQTIFHPVVDAGCAGKSWFGIMLGVFLLRNNCLLLGAAGKSSYHHMLCTLEQVSNKSRLHLFKSIFFFSFWATLYEALAAGCRSLGERAVAFLSVVS